MESITKASLTQSEIEKIVSDLPGAYNILSIKELTDGCFNTSYLVTTETGEEYVMKVAPPESVSLLTYEQNLIHNEISFNKLLKEKTEVPLPGIIKEDLTGSIIPNGYFITEKLQGIPLDKVESVTEEHRNNLYLEIAKYFAEMHSIESEYFGYPFMNDGVVRDSYQSFKHMIDLVLKDGDLRNVSFPVNKDKIIQLIVKHKSAFDNIRKPVFVHYDLWDGNIFVKEEGNQFIIDGLIDFERGFYADPAADFSQIHGYMDLEVNQWFFHEYNKFAKEPFHVDEDAFTRIKLYRFYLFLIMIVESYYRDVNGSYNDQLKWSEEEFLKLYNGLK